MKKLTMLTLALLLTFAVGAFACGEEKTTASSASAESSCSAKKTAKTASVGEISAQMAAAEEGAVKHVDVEGQLVCLGCSLKKAEGANAECSTFGHKHALKTADGAYLSLLENKFSADLVKGEKYHNKNVSIHGVYHANANVLDVETFSVDGKAKSWCGGCKSMDGCSAGK